MSCRAVPCRAVPCCAVPCRAVPCRAVPCRAVLRHAVSCRVMSRRAVMCRAVPCCAVLCRAVPCRAVLRHAVSCRVMSRRAVMCCAVPCRDGLALVAICLLMGFTPCHSNRGGRSESGGICRPPLSRPGSGKWPDKRAITGCLCSFSAMSSQPAGGHVGETEPGCGISATALLKF